MWTGIAALRAKATMAVPPSQQNWLAGVTAPPRAAVMDARFSLGNTASIVAPLRSRATMTGICSAESPRLTASPARSTRNAGSLAFEGFQNKRLIAFDNSRQILWLVQAQGFKKPVPPPECRRVIDVTSFRGLRNAGPVDQGAGLFKPLIFLPQMDQRRFRQSVEGPP